MSAHCVNCGTDMVYGHGEDWQLKTCPVCDLRAEVARLEQKCAMWEALAEKGKEWTIAAEADFAAARAREQALRGVLADFANPQHWAIDRSFAPPKAVWIGTWEKSPVEHARAALAAEPAADERAEEAFPGLRAGMASAAADEPGEQ